MANDSLLLSGTVKYLHELGHHMEADALQRVLNENKRLSEVIRAHRHEIGLTHRTYHAIDLKLYEALKD